LLGQSFLSKLSAWSIDNQRGLLVLSDQKVSAVNTKTDSPALELVRAFYHALSQGDSPRASLQVIPEKRVSGPFSPDNLSRFYGSLSESLRLIDVKLTASTTALAESTYVVGTGRRCAGRSIVYLTTRGPATLIERISALAGC